MAFATSTILAAEAEFPSKQFFIQHCEKCHSGVKSKGDFAVARLTAEFTDKQNRERWLTVLEQLSEGTMPPEEEPRPPVKDVQSLMDWISTQDFELSAKRETNRKISDGANEVA